MPSASRALISAALGGLLLFGTSACSSDENEQKAPIGTAGGGGRSGTGGGSGTGAMAGSAGTAGSAGATGPDGAAGSAGNADAGDLPDSGADADASDDGAGSQDAPDAGSSGDASDASSAADACFNPSGIYGEDAAITSSTEDPEMTLEKFTLLCNQRGGVVELLCHCGGANNCKGLSFDTTTMTLIEHTCKGMNSCAGYSCVIP